MVDTAENGKKEHLLEFYVTGTRTVVQNVTTTVLAKDRQSAYQLAAKRFARRSFGDSDVSIVNDDVVGYNVDVVSPKFLKRDLRSIG